MDKAITTKDAYAVLGSVTYENRETITAALAYLAFSPVIAEEPEEKTRILNIRKELLNWCNAI